MDSPKGHQAKCGASPAPKPADGKLNLEEVRARLRERRGPELWRSLDELAATPEFQDMLHREFPRHAAEWRPAPEEDGGVSRRAFFQLSGAALALAGLTGCTRQPLEKIVPYVSQPEQVIPGRPLFFATTLTLGGYGMGCLAESHEGRPTKIEGNDDHPASLGATDIFAQAAVLGLYDPQRSQSVLRQGRVNDWSGLLAQLGPLLQAKREQGGEGLRILTGTVTSPTFAGQMQLLLERFPRARWHRWEPAGRHQSRAGAQRAFGKPLETRYDLSRAAVVLALDADLLSSGPGAVRYARDFATRRRVRPDKVEMNRLYVVESTPTGTGTLADHRLLLPPAEVERFLASLAGLLGVTPGAISGQTADPANPAKQSPAAASAAPAQSAEAARVESWLQAVAADLKANQGSSLVVVDEYASPAAHVLAHAVNQALGNVGSTVIHSEAVEVDPVDHLQSLRELLADMNGGKVDLLILLDGTNPVFTAPADLDFAHALEKVTLSLHHGLYEDETSAYCHWHVPAAHELESWGDARAFDGTSSLRQPLIDPLYGGRSSIEMLATLLGRDQTTGYELVREQWTGKLGAAGEAFDLAFRRALHDGVIPNTALPPVAAAPAGQAVQQALSEIGAAAAAAETTPGAAAAPVTLLFRPDPTIYDGSFAENVWLQELPKPISKLTWDNALFLSPATAQRLKLEMEQRVEIGWQGRKLLAAVWILPGQARDTALLTLGYGRELPGSKAHGLGFNAYALRTSGALWRAPGVTIRGLGGPTFNFACTQNHHLLDKGAGIGEMELAGREQKERHVVRTGTLEEYRQRPGFPHEEQEAPARDVTQYPNRDYSGRRWGMSIDLSVCTGCSSCVVACQAENNIPTVGKDQVLREREMHWIRIDRYFEGPVDDPRIHLQPVPCMQCENAPCEVVCPVAATSHSDEGLNDMVYNRCVGTRYCSNNCPYKVRRFNFLRYSERTSPVLAMLQNPDVSVRMRGVMEKCTYCVQRIEHAKIDSKVTGKPIEEARLKTACQQACPTQAIVFGDLSQPGWEVTRRQADPRSYGLLEELNTRPRTTYLAKLANPNPRLAAAERT